MSEHTQEPIGRQRAWEISADVVSRETTCHTLRAECDRVTNAGLVAGYSRGIVVKALPASSSVREPGPMRL